VSQRLRIAEVIAMATTGLDLADTQSLQFLIHQPHPNATCLSFSRSPAIALTEISQLAKSVCRSLNRFLISCGM
jgi:hypothetical protein